MATLRGILLACVLLAFAACGAGGGLDPSDGGTGGQYLPTVTEVDSGQIPLTDGVFNGDGNDLVLTEPASNAAVRLVDGATVASGNDIYDLDADGDMDFVVLTIRALSAQAAANDNARNSSGAVIPAGDFNKVGGAAFEPLSASFTTLSSLTLPVHSAAGAGAGTTLNIYQYIDGTIDGRDTASWGEGIGVWEHFTTANVDSTGNTITFSASNLGQYCVAVAEIVHTQGGGTSI